MIRKISVAVAVVALTATAVIGPANAASKISQGVACSVKGKVTKVGTDKYVCTTNPASTSKKLVWVWQGCLDANTAYLASKSQYDTLIKQVTSTQSQNADAISKLQLHIQNSINSLITWKSSKNYTKDDVVYLPGKTYYVALDSSNNVSPDTSLGTHWAIYQPSPTDATVGTSPTADQVITWKQQDVTDWQAAVTKLTTDLTKLQGYKNPDTKTTNLIKQIQSLITTYNLGIKNAQTNIKNLKASVSMLTTQNTNQSTLGAQKATIQSVKADVAQSKTMMIQSCANGL